MRFISLEESADYLEAATIEQTLREQGTIVHIGKSSAGVRFVLINNIYGQTVLNEAM